MGYAPIAQLDAKNVHGCFTNTETRAYFEYSLSQPGAPWAEYSSLVYVGPAGETRWAKVLRTVAYVVIDEAADGSPVVERWEICKHREWA